MITWRDATTAYTGATASGTSSRFTHVTQEESGVQLFQGLTSTTTQTTSYSNVVSATTEYSFSVDADNFYTVTVGVTAITTRTQGTSDSDGATTTSGHTSRTFFTSELRTATTTESQQTANEVVGPTSSSSTTISISNSYTIDSSTTRTITSSLTTTRTSTSAYQYTKGTTTSTTTNNVNSTTQIITTTTANTTQSTLRTTGTTVTRTVDTSTTLSTGSIGSSFFYVTGVKAGFNEWIAVLNPNNGGVVGKVTDNFFTFTGNSTFKPKAVFIPIETFILPTIETTNATSGTSTVDTQVYVFDNSSTFVNLSTSTISVTITSAVTNAVRPYTSQSNTASHSLYTTSSTFTIYPFTSRSIAGITFPSTTVTLARTTYEMVHAVSTDTFIFRIPDTHSMAIETMVSLGFITSTISTFLGRTSYGGGDQPWGAGTATSILNSVIHTGFDTSYSETFDIGGATITQKISEGFEAGAGFQTLDSTARKAAFDFGNVRGTLWQKIHFRTQLLVPNAGFSNQDSFGSHISPGFPPQFIIPNTWGMRADGAALPLPANSSTILTFNRNSDNGGNNGTVHSNNWTTFSWRFTNDSLSVTTSSTFTQLNGTVTITSTVSSSISTVLLPQGNNSHVFFTQKVPSNSFTVFSHSSVNLEIIPVGGKQKVGNATFNQFPMYVLGTSYHNNNSGSFEELLESVRTAIINNEADLSVLEHGVFYWVQPGNFTSMFPTLANDYVDTYDRNYLPM